MALDLTVAVSSAIPRRREHLAPHVAFFVTLLAVTPARADNGCLYANGTSSEDAATCRTLDPIGIRTDPSITAAIRFLNIDEPRIVFVGCSDARFGTRISRSIPRRIYTITYRLNGDVSKGDLVAATLHELSHVYQLEEGDESISDITRRLGIERIELGADFVAGVSFARSGMTLARTDFEHSLNLTGGYVSADSDHGWPEDRLSAFRMGFFYDRDVSLADAYVEFQRDLYGEIKHMNRSR